jgi:hypothetical protein
MAVHRGSFWFDRPVRSFATHPAPPRLTTVKLPDRTGTLALATFNWGHPHIVVAAGAVWARNPDHTVSRIDPKTGRLVATIDIEADSIAADDDGVWAVNGTA